MQFVGALLVGKFKMAITYPRNDIIQSIGVVSQSFSLLSRGEFSRMKNGVTISKNWGSAIWMGEWASKDKFHDAAIDFEAMIASLDDGIGEFYAYDTRRPMPKSKPNGDFADTGYIQAVSGQMREVSFMGLPPGMVLSRGDYFCYHYGVGDAEVALHQLMENAVVSPGGGAPLIEVRPHIRPGYVAGTTPVKFKNPYGKFRLFPQAAQFNTANIQQSNAVISAFQVIG